MSIIEYFKISGAYITLGQFLKEESIVASGGQAKFYLRENPATLNGKPENRRGKKLYAGDKLNVNGQQYEFQQEE